MKYSSFFTSALAVLAFSVDAKMQQPYQQKQEQQRQLIGSIIDFANNIQNAVPTVPTTPPPTQSPTVSAAPSPFPSGSPTLTPTVSTRPSTTPTIAPTISPEPTDHPTSSSAPTTSPSHSPTEIPSASPTKFPTYEPTISMAPTNAPTVSAAPTQIYLAVIQGTTTVVMDGIETEMNATQLALYKAVTTYFIQEFLQDVEGAFLVTSVIVQDQSVVESSSSSSNNTNSDTDLALEVVLNVTAEYESYISPEEFDFDQALRNGFEQQTSQYYDLLLKTKDPVFAPLDPIVRRANRASEDEPVLSKGGYIAIICVSILMSLCGCGIAYYAVQRKRVDSDKGDKLSEMDLGNDQVGSGLSDDQDDGVSLKYSKSVEIIQVHDGVTNHDDEDDDGDATNNKNDNNAEPETPSRALKKKDTIDGIIKSGQQSKQPASPNTMENGYVAGSRLGALAESILRSESFGSNRDPPESSGYMYAPKVRKGDPAATRSSGFNLPRSGQQQQHQSQDNQDDLNSRGINNDSRRDPSVVGAPNFITNVFRTNTNKKEPEQGNPGPVFQKTNPSAGVPAAAGRAASASAKQDGQTNTNNDVDWSNNRNNNSESIQLTVGRNGKLSGEPAPPANFQDPRSSSRARNGDTGNGRMDPITSPSSSAVSSSINAFLNMVGGTLGAAPLASPAKKAERNQNFHDVLQREGLYDVFAPSGALGIVVDTTKDGPAVHSLKQTSPMLGLINPGDLIVGLDSQDTRSMTAATLTRLMASKSNQRERKITLLASDKY